MSNRYDRDDHSDNDAVRREDPSWQTGYRHEDEDRDNGRRSDLRSDLRSGRFGEGGIRPNRDQDYNRYGNAERRPVPRDEQGNAYAAYSPYASGRDNAGRDNRQSGRQGYPQSAGRYPDGYQPSERSPSVRGVYQEQVWTRDPDNGNVYGYEYTRRLPSPNYGNYRSSDANYDSERGRWSDDPSRRDWTGASREWGSVDALRTGGHSGKGPKGYVRSDERIREDVSDRLSDDDEVDASQITVTVSNGEVRLEGNVADRHSKHRAEDIAESVSGVRDVSNQLRAKKGFFQELGDKLSGDDDGAHRGHAGSGTRNSPSGSAPKSNVSATR